jgi:hypothetical protein
MTMIPFEYRDFWEVPRLIVCTLAGIEILLDSEFDEATNEYAGEYKVYAMPPALDLDRLPPGAEMPTEEARYLGSIAVSAIEFDSTKRKAMDAEPVLALLRNGG